METGRGTFAMAPYSRTHISHTQSMCGFVLSGVLMVATSGEEKGGA